MLGSIFEDLGKFYDAIKLYQKAIGLKNDFPVAKSQLIKCKGIFVIGIIWRMKMVRKYWNKRTSNKSTWITLLSGRSIKQLKRAKNFLRRNSQTIDHISPKKKKYVVIFHQISGRIQ